MTDLDWHKVYLSAGSNVYFSLDRSAEVQFTITDGSGNVGRLEVLRFRLVTDMKQMADILLRIRREQDQRHLPRI